MQNNGLQKAAQIIQAGQSAVICIPEKPSIDTVAAATSLYLGLTGIGKNVSLACSTPIQSDIFAADKIQQEISTSGDNLVIALPLKEGSIDKIHYVTTEENLNIIVKPGEGFPKIEPEDIKYSYTGGTVDFIVTIDTDHPRRLGELYAENKDLFKGKNLINIDRHLTNSFYGGANLVSRNSSSTSELIYSLLKGIKVPLDQEIATNLYAGLVAATNNFSSYSTSAGTFEAAAELLKLGASKKIARKKDSDGFESVSQIENKTFSARNTGETKPIEDIEYEDEDEDAEDWLKPKILRDKRVGGGGEGA